MPGGKQLPYRAPCGGWKPDGFLWIGGRWSHYDGAHKAIPRYLNTTKVPDYADPPGVDIDPYERPNFPGSIPTCGEEVLCGVAGEPGCGPWPEPVPANAYTLSETPLNLATCRKRGFKSVQALKWWHGRWGYNSSNWFAPDSLNLHPGPVGAYAIGQILGECRSEVTSPDETRYRTITVEAEIDFDTSGNPDPEGDPVVPYNAAASFTSTVAKNTGVKTASHTVGSVASEHQATIWALLEYGDYNASLVYNLWKTRINNILTTGTWIDDGLVIAVSTTGTETTWEGTPDPMGISEYHRIFKMDPAAGVYEIEYTSDDAVFGGTATSTYTEVWTVTQTGLSIVIHERSDSNGTPNVFNETTTTLTATLSDPYTGADLDADIAELLDEWNLADDAEYPWRGDLNVTIAPLVRRHEVQQAVEPEVFTFTGTYTDANAANFTGDILGSPLPPGYVGHFDFRHEVWRKCFSGSDQWYIRGFGANVPAYLPQNATGWTNWKQAADWGRRGAFSIHFPGVRVAQKWAEAKEHFRSHNYFRPCGPDRFLVDQATARCITALSGSPVVVTIETDDGEPDIDTGDLCVACGIEGDSGLWEVTKLAGNQFRLQTRVADLPAGYECSGEMFGKVRFPEAWAVCGRIKIVSASNESPIVIALDEGAPCLRDGDSVTISGVEGNTAANGTFTWTRINDNMGTLDGSTGSGAYTTGGFLKSAGAPDYQWHDDGSKGDHVLLSWDMDFRDLGEYNRRVAAGCLTPTTAPRADQLANGLEQAVETVNCSTHCLPFTPCCPAAICISPNAESFPNGTTHAFGAVKADDIYGDAWQAVPVQAVDDPLWQVPKKDCAGYGDTFSWVRDNGGCQSDGFGTRYYPMPLQVEARCAPPSGAPALPAGVFVGWLTQEELDVPGPVAGNVANPPFPLASDSAGQPVTVPTVWSIRAAQEACVCELGRFSEQYERDGVSCPNPEFIP